LNRIAPYGLLFLFLSLSWKSYGVTANPIVQRACLDRNTGVLTVYYKSLSDGCGSFAKMILFGRDNSSNPFISLSEHTNVSATQITAPLPNKKKWELYVAVLFACNGVDTLFSNVIFIDDTPPAYLEPDSVSIDLVTQKVIAGWSKAPEPDIMGYSMFKVDPGTGNNTVIDEQDVLSYTFNTSTFDATLSGNKLALAAYDSCKNGGIISSYHSPVLLQFINGQNVDHQCTRSIYMSWTAYVGWPTLSQDVYVKDDVSNNWYIVASIPAGQLNYTFSIPFLGRKYSFFIRSHKTSSGVTSSSNIIQFTTFDFQKPSLLTIKHVSVIDDNTINITGIHDVSPSISKALLQVKNYGSSSWATIATYTPPTLNFSLNHTGLTTQSSKYVYRILLLNTCNAPFDSSKLHISVLLRRNFNNFTWNEYWGWQSLPYSSNLLERNKSGSTWNSLNTSPDSFYFLLDTSRAYCYKVASILTGLNNKPIDTAYSNSICIRVLDTTLIPNTFTPEGINPIFKITNPNLQLGQAQMLILNRWGQEVFKGDALIGWDGKDPKGSYCGPGFYPYLIEVFTPEKREAYKGTVMVLR
jgi:hypothetical protein